MKEMSGFVLGILAFVHLLPAREARADPFEYAWQQLAPGVWAGIRQDPFELPQEGNSVFVVTGEGVVVFDAGGSPLMGESIVAKVRSVTGEPITQVIISHWHGDHMRGLQAIRAAFPAARVIAHPHSRELIASTQDRWLKRRTTMVPNIVKSVREALANGRDLTGRPLIREEKTWLQNGLAISDQLDRENKRTTYVVPDATFEDRLTLYLGGKEIQFLHPGKAHTAGDIVMWLPQEKIVATGDIVTGPVPLMPSPWTDGYGAVLTRVKALGFATLVPGHGPVEHDSRYLDLLAETIQTVSAQMKGSVARGLSEKEAVASIDLSALEKRFTGGDAFLANRFHDYVSDSLPAAAWAVETRKAPTEAF